jgi:1-aminocyclopropane-1-carboxylate deaminase/D-cysteine desulfhydrase-like pyridoxal-dependent ACC family enzyme
MTNLEAYIRESESQGSKHCVVPTETLRVLLDVVEAAKELLENHEEATGSCAVCLSDGRGTHAEQLETALQKLEKARRG